MMQGDDRLPIVEFLSRTIGRFTDTRPRSEKELKKGFLISPPRCDNSIVVGGRVIWRHYTYRIEILFRIDNVDFKRLHKRFFDAYSAGHAHRPPMIFVNFEHAAMQLCGARMSPLILDADSQAAALRYVEANGPYVFDWIRGLSNADRMFELYQKQSWLRATWYPLVFYVLTKAVHGKEAAISYARGLEGEDLPEMMSAMAEFLKAEQP